MSSATRSGQGVITNPHLAALETQLANRIRREVVIALEENFQELDSHILPHFVKHHGNLANHIKAMNNI